MIGQNRAMIGNISSPTSGTLDYLIGEILTFQVVRIFNNKTYLLSDVVSFPFVTGDFVTELAEGKWIEILTAPPSDGKEYSFKNGVWIENDKSFTFELPWFFWNRFTTTGFARLGITSGSPTFNIDTGVTDHNLLVPNSNSLIYRIPKDCKLTDVYFAGNIAGCELSIWQTSNFNGANATELFFGTGSGGVVASNVNSNCSKDYFLHIFPRNLLNTSGTNNGRIFLKFK